MSEYVIPFVRKVAHLAVVAAQSCHLCLKCVGNVAEIIRFFSTPEKDFFNFVRLKPLFKQVRIGPAVSGVGENSVQYNLTGDAVVAMPDIPPVGIAGSYDFWPMSPD